MSQSSSSASDPDRVINMHEAKTRLSQLGELAWSGKRVIISRAGKPYLELIPFREQKTRRPGRLKGKIQMAEDFDAPSDDITGLFEGQE